MRIFILDDEIERHDRIKLLLGHKHEYISAMSFDEAVEMSRRLDTPDIIFIDNDLKTEHYKRHMESASDLFQDTGYAFIKHLVNNDIWYAGLYVVHTMNPVAGHIILRMLSEASRTAVLLPIYCLPDDPDIFIEGMGHIGRVGTSLIEEFYEQ